MKILNFLFFLCLPFVAGAQTGTVGDPFTALGHAWHVPASGIYYFSIGAANFSTYVESGSGWILIASGNDATEESSYTVTSALTLQSDAILPASVYASTLITAVRINATSGPDLPLDVQSNAPAVLSNLRNNITLSANTNSPAWTGTGTGLLTRACAGNSTSLATRIYHACGIGTNLHWQVGQNAGQEKVRLSNSSKNDLNLWVRTDPVVLPAAITSFGAGTLGDKTVELIWQTTHGSKIKSFVVERSRDGISWEVVKTVKTSGIDAASQHYKVYDESPYAGLGYYRLKQMDTDGRYVFSKIVPVNVSAGALLKVYPNPVVNGKLIVSLAERSSIELYNHIGRLVFSRQLPAGTRELDLSALAGGFYILKVGTSKTKILIR